jgi:hypothetical protein
MNRRSHDHTSFLFGMGSKEETKEDTASAEDVDVKKINEVNKRSVAEFNAIKKWTSTSHDSRTKMDAAMNARIAQLRPLCHEYMRHLAELKGLAGSQCQAAQGRVNGADLDESNGPFGCLASDEAGSESNGTPVVLNGTRCTKGVRRLLCTERLAELLRGDPPPGEQFLKKRHHAQLEPGAEEHIHKHSHPDVKEGTAPPPSGTEGPTSANSELGLPEEPEEQSQSLSMDQEIRKWCAPGFRLMVSPISNDLSRGVLAPTIDTGQAQEG